MTEMQSDFEDWLKKFYGGSLTNMPAAIEYVAWQAWQASRAAIVVKLPEPKSSVESVFSMKVTKSLDDIGVYYE